MSLLACVSAHLLENLEKNLSRFGILCSTLFNRPSGTMGDAAASIAILAKAAVSEARSAQSNLRQQLQVLSGIGLVSPAVSHWG